MKFACDPWAWFGSLVCILLAAYALRVGGLVSESLWIDEGFSLALASQSLPGVVQGTAADQHPPFYYLVLWAWLGLGRTIFSLRYLSALLGTLGVAAGAWVGRQLLGERVGLGTALLLACSPLHVWYSQEARMYVLLALLTTLSTGMLWRLAQRKQGWFWYGCCTVLALYTHLFSVFVLLFQNAVVFVYLVREIIRERTISRGTGKFTVRWLGAQGAILAAFVPWVPIALYQTRYHQMEWVAPASLTKVGGTLLLLLLGEAGVSPLGVLAWGALALPALHAITTVWRARRWTKLHAYGFVLAWFLVPFATITLLSRVYPIFQSKQMLMLLTPLAIVVVGGLTRVPRLLQVVLVCILAVLVVSSLGAMYRVETKDDWRGAAAYIEERYSAGDVLYLNPAAGVLTLETYLSRPLPYQGYPPEYDVRTGGWQSQTVTRAIAEDRMAGLAGYRRIWLIEFGPEFWDPEGHLRGWLGDHGQAIAEEGFGRVQVHLYDIARGPASP